MRIHIILLATILLAAGCQDKSTDQTVQHGSYGFTAQTECFAVDSKTSMTPERNILWSKGDQIAIFMDCQEASCYEVTDATAGTSRGEFKLIGSQTEQADCDKHIAIYPYQGNIECTEVNSKYQITNLVLPEIQAYTDGSFANGTFFMAAFSQNSNLNFKNISGALKLQLTGDSTIKSIKLEGNNGEKLSGRAIVTIHTDGSVPTIEMAENAATSVTIDCGDGIQLNTANVTSFIFALPPVTFSKGFTFTLSTTDGKTETLKASASNEILRSSVLTMPVRDLSGLEHKTFTESNENIANPERGFYFCQSFKSASSSLLTANTIKEKRLKNMTICYLGFYPKDYMYGHIADSYLQMVRQNMQVLRENGAKCIMRFAYSDSESEKPWDPTPEVVKMHIADIKPILQEYSDVIMCFQAGFVGVWGEWYYTDNFDKSNGDDDYELRKQVVDAMLDALPTDRSVALRTPLFKKMMYAGSYDNILTDETAYNGSALARIGGFNDCFGASSTDYGTFNAEDSREYWKNESKYTLMGGETCGVSDYCKCEVSLKDMEDYHWTYLNDEYNRNVHSVWKNGGCWDEVERRLGYRLSLTDAYHSSSAFAGNDFNVKVNIKNTGFAAPMNPRAVELILIDENGTKTVYDLSKDVDPRYWFAGGTYTIETDIALPSNAKGDCVLYLNLPDPKPTLHDNPYFSIRLANEEDIWDKNTGYNKLCEFTIGKTVVPEPEPEPEDTPNAGGTASGENISYGSQYNPWK